MEKKIATTAGCISAAAVFFVTTVLPILIVGVVLWFIFGR